MNCTRRPRRAALVLAAVAAAFLGASPMAPLAAEEHDQPGPGTGGGANNVVSVRNQQDGTLRSRASAQIAQDAGPIVGNTNLAEAAASCVDCQVVAVAVQVVIRSGDVSVDEPGNAAIAVNEGCLRCLAFAYARQEILRADRPVPVSGDAMAEVNAIEAEMQDVAASGLSDLEMWPLLDDLSERLVAVVEAEIANAGAAATRSTGRQVDRDEG